MITEVVTTVTVTSGTTTITKFDGALTFTTVIPSVATDCKRVNTHAVYPAIIPGTAVDSDIATFKRLREEGEELMAQAEKKFKDAEKIQRRLSLKVGNIVYSRTGDQRSITKYIITEVQLGENLGDTGYMVESCNTIPRRVSYFAHDDLDETYFNDHREILLRSDAMSEYRHDFISVNIPDDLEEYPKIYYVENGTIYDCNVIGKRDLNSEEREYHIRGQLHSSYNQEWTPGSVDQWINGNAPGAFGMIGQACSFAASFREESGV
jgi:hypothetical protein